jgi:hypothetical protein
MFNLFKRKADIGSKWVALEELLNLHAYSIKTNLSQPDFGKNLPEGNRYAQIHFYDGYAEGILWAVNRMQEVRKNI